VDLWRSLRYARRYRNWRELSRIRSRGEKPGRALLRNGLVFEAPADVNVVRSVAAGFWKNYYTPPGFEIGPADVVVDVGANIGSFSACAALRTRGPIVAVEPFPSNAEYLRRNVAANGFGVRVVEAALCDFDGEVELLETASGTTHRMRESGDAASGIRVRALTLASVMQEQSLEHIDLLKLDCEGAEGRILPAALEVLPRVRQVTMEFHDATSPLDHGALRSLLESAGYRTTLRWDGRSQNGYLYASR